MKNPEIYKYLDISTVHVHKEDMRILQKASSHEVFNDAPVNFPYDTGTFIAVGEEASQDEWEKAKKVSKEFLNILDQARSKGCTFVRLDADGAEYGDLPKIDW